MLLGTGKPRGLVPLFLLLCVVPLLSGGCVSRKPPAPALAPAASPADTPTTPAVGTGGEAPAPVKKRKKRRREMLARGTPAEAKPAPQPIDDALPDFTTSAGSTPSSASAELYIRELGGAVLAKLGDKSLKKSDQIAYFSSLLARDLDIPLIARFALGGHWATASRQQRDAYLSAFGEFIVSSYSRRLGGVKVTAFEILESRPVGRRDMIVRTRVKQRVGDSVRADWRLRLKSGRYRIIDLSVEGISLALTMRQEFAAVLKSKGGVDGLVESIRARTLDAL